MAIKNPIIYSLPKEGETNLGNRDASNYSIMELSNGNILIKIAIADGATQSYLSQKWAQFIVNQTITFQEPTKGKLIKKFLTLELFKKWNQEVNDYIITRQNEGNPLKWYEEEGIESGSDSTFLSVQINYNKILERGIMYASAIGDTCLFLRNQNGIKKRFPISRSNLFNNTPPLISSVIKDLTKIGNYEKNIRSGIFRQDILYFMTDALAMWFIIECENNKRPWDEIDKNCKDLPTFKNWISYLRQEKLLQNDDVTLVRLELE